MTDGWYYGHDGERLGPFSGRELHALALSGALQRTDTVWRTGIEEGVPASTVKRLFATADDLLLPVEPAPADVAEITPEQPAPVAVLEPVPRQQPPAPPHKVRRLSVVAVKGAVVMSQDGERVKFKKKCVKCKHEDSSWTTSPITVGIIKASFFCPKCRQRCDVELRGRQD